MQSGFGKMSLIAPLTVVADDGRKFQSRAKYRPSDDEELQMIVSGAVRSSTGKTFRVDLQAELKGHATTANAAKSGAQAEDIYFDAETTVVARGGEYTVLAAAPTSTASGDAVAVIVRVTAH